MAAGKSISAADYDVIVIGAGAAGMMCAAQAGLRGRRTLLIEHTDKLGERIRISGGGRCNFTNRSVTAQNYLSQNPHFCHSALARYSAQDFITLVERYGIGYHERDHGQLFCNESATDIIRLLKTECEVAAVEWAMPCRVDSVIPIEGEGGYRFLIESGLNQFRCQSLVIATGGLAAPKIGATPFGYKVAEQFGIAVIAPKPALVPLALAPETLGALEHLSGNAFEAITRCEFSGQLQNVQFRENVLITHRGLSGPATLQISSYWLMQDYALKPGSKKQPVAIDLLPDVDAGAWLTANRNSSELLPNLLAEKLPRGFAQEWCALHGWSRPLHAFSPREIDLIAKALKGWTLMPSGTLGYNKAEVTLGGVDTAMLSSKTFEVKTMPGLYFIGEVVDVTGWLGGYNFQWAWSSGWVAGQNV